MTEPDDTFVDLPVERRRNDRRRKSVPVAVDRRQTDRRANAIAPSLPFTGVAVVIDALPLVRAGICMVLMEHGMRVAAEETTLKPALEAVGDRLDLVVVSAPDESLVDAVAAAKGDARGPDDEDTRVIVLMDRLDAAELRALLIAGADGVLQRNVSRVDLRAACERVLAGQRVLAGGPLSVLAGAGLELAAMPVPEEQSTVPVLTAKEGEVLALLAQRQSNREIAKGLHVSEATVKTHLSNIYGKLDVNGRQAAVEAALQRGLLA